MNSTRVAGGVPPPVHFRPPAQSPVVHFPAPVSSNVQPVRPQKRPDQPGGAENWTDAPGDNAKPPFPSTAAPLPESVPGHNVLVHLFSRVNVVGETLLAAIQRKMSMKL